MQLNKYILCAMDKRKTKEELMENCDAAANAAADAYAAANAAAYVAYAAYEAAEPAAYASAYAEHWLNKYFEITGENREDYEREIAK